MPVGNTLFKRILQFVPRYTAICLVRTVLDAPWSVNAVELNCSLHWLPAKQRIYYKVVCMATKLNTAYYHITFLSFLNYYATVSQPDNFND